MELRIMSLGSNASIARFVLGTIVENKAILARCHALALAGEFLGGAEGSPGVATQIGIVARCVEAWELPEG
jgi:hypothetical protein